jgi:hypothetical protein
MSRFRTPLLILGLVGALVVAAAVVVVIRLGRGAAVELPVAIDDIPPGIPLETQRFRLAEVRGLDEHMLDAYITADDFGSYVGYPLVETVHAGFPVGKAQVQTDDPNLLQGRLTLLLEDPTHLVYPLPVTADQVGNYIVAGDRVDVIFTLGRVAAQEMSHGEVVEELEEAVVGAGDVTTGTAPAPIPVARPGQPVTTTAQLPVAKVILPDVHVLRVEREQVRSASATYGVTGEGARQTTVEGDVVRLYLEVDREQAEVLSFALHNGALNLPARAEVAGGTSEGFVWDDFVELFFEARGDER